MFHKATDLGIFKLWGRERRKNEKGKERGENVSSSGSLLKLPGEPRLVKSGPGALPVGAGTHCLSHLTVSYHSVRQQEAEVRSRSWFSNPAALTTR